MLLLNVNDVLRLVFRVGLNTWPFKVYILLRWLSPHPLLRRLFLDGHKVAGSHEALVMRSLARLCQALLSLQWVGQSVLHHFVLLD